MALLRTTQPLGSRWRCSLVGGESPIRSGMPGPRLMCTRACKSVLRLKSGSLWPSCGSSLGVVWGPSAFRVLTSSARTEGGVAARGHDPGGVDHSEFRGYVVRGGRRRGLTLRIGLTTPKDLLFGVTVCLCFWPGAVGCAFTRRTEQQRLGALATLALIHRGEDYYFEAYGRFAGSLSDLGPPAQGPPRPTASALIPDRLAKTGERLGYKFRLTTTATGYQITARPVTFGVTGEWTFLSESPARLPPSPMSVRAHHGPEPPTLADPETAYGFRNDLDGAKQLPRPHFAVGSD